MKLTCSKCSQKIEINRADLLKENPKVQCPGCGSRFRLKPRSGAPPVDQIQTTSDLRARTTPSLPLPEAPRENIQTPSRAQSSSPISITPPLPPPPVADGPTLRTPADWTGPAPASAVGGHEDKTLISTGAGRSLAQGSRPSAASYPAHGPAPPIFQPGDHLAGRYRIVQFIAQGGMGEVYEAEDIELRQEVALKTVSARIGDEVGAVDRFKREIALARRVTHPNVCRIFDLGQHQPPEGTTLADGRAAAPIVFLSMELLKGETLSARLRQCHRLLPAEAKPLITQMTAALYAAHSARVVHRDFKSENVFLVPEGEPGSETTRVVVTDFGIARGSDASDQFASQVTGLGIVGTPAYMAPEQVQNAPEITAAADIYALGIVIYEMVTGKLPFESSNPLTTAVKRLQEEPPPPHIHAPDLPAYWERAILKCLERRPEDRFETVLEVAEALEPPQRQAPARQPEPSSSPEPIKKSVPSTARSSALRSSTGQPATVRTASGAPASSDPRTGKLAALLVVVMAISILLWWTNRDELDPRDVKLRRAIAVWGFDNVTGRDESSWIATALTEMISTELAKSEDLRGVTSQEIAEARRQLDWTQGEPSPGVLEQVRRLTGSDFVVSGSFVSLPGGGEDAKLRLDLRLQDAAQGKTLTQLSKEGSTSDLFAMVAEVGNHLLETLGSTRAADGASGQPRDPQAARLYAEALTAFRSFQTETARDLLEEAAQLEPDNPLIRSALSSTWGALGFSKQATSEAERAFDLSSGLPQEERLVIEGRYREMRSDWSAARDVYRTLWLTFPDQLDYGLGLVSAQLAARDPQGALLTIDQLRRLPPPLSEDPRIDLKEAAAAGTVSQIERQAAASGRAVAKAEIAGSQLLLARALLSRSQAQRLLGQPEEAVASASRALEAFAELSHTPGRADALSALAGAQLDQGRADLATEGFRQALELHRTLGSRGGQAATLNNLAVIRKRAGDLDDAEDLYRETEAIYREVGDARGIALTTNNRAVILVDRDRLSEALSLFEGAQETWEKMGGPAKAYALNNIAEVMRLQGELSRSLDRHQEALSLRREAGLKIDQVISLANLGALHLAKADLETSEQSLTEALTLAEEAGDPTAKALVLFYTGELHRERGDLDSAYATHQSALDLRAGLGQSGLLTSSRIALARVAVDQQSFEEAVDLASQAKTSCQLDDRPAEEVLAAAVLIDALSELDRHTEALSVIEETQALARDTQQPAVRIAFARTETLYGARSKPRSAFVILNELASEAQALGLTTLELELQVDWAEAALLAKDQQAAAQKLEKIQQDARKRDLGRIAERAALLLFDSDS